MFEFARMTPVVVGVGAIDKLSEKAKQAGVTKVLLVVDPFLKEATAKMIVSLQEAGIDSVVFDGVVPDPTDISVYAAHKVLVEAGGVDGIVGMGGGSAIDTAKAVNCAVNNPPPLWKHSVSGGWEPCKPGLPLFLVSSTAGTGAEVTAPAMITFTEKGLKSSLRHNGCTFANWAFVDPQLCLTMPRSLTVATGIDALCHAAESMTVIRPNPISDALAKEAIRLIFKYLPLVLEDEQNIVYREKMSVAAMLAGQAFAVTLVHMGHAIGHGIGAVLHRPHGNMVGAALPWAMNYVSDVYSERVKDIGECMGMHWSGGESSEEIGKRIAEHIYAFYKKIGLPSLAELGLQRQEVINCAPAVLSDACNRYSPKAAMTEEEIRAALAQVFDQII